MLIEKGTVLSQRYELLDYLGKGGMSEVWQGRHIHLDKMVAVKLLHKDLTEKKEFLARFKLEAQIASKLNHPNICGVSDFGFTEDDIPFIVMEYLEGESLAAVLKRTDRLPVGSSLSIIRQSVSGLKAAHRIGVVHRDIKPGNIFITREKSGARVVKVLDFGISKMLVGKKGDLGLTTTGTLLGTAFYLSPEQIMESRGVDQRTDLYAAGTVLYKLVTGKVPFMGENFGEVAVKVVNDPLVDPRELVEGLPPKVSRIIRKAMEKDPRARYQDADEMLADLDRAFEEYQGDTIEALYKPGLENLILKPSEYSPPRYGRKLRIAAIGTSVMLLVGAAALFAFFFMNGTAWNARGPSSPPRTVAAVPAAPDASFVKPAAAGEPETVKIRPRGMPPGTTFKIGEQELTGDLLEIEKFTSPVDIVVSAEGFQIRTVKIVPVSDMEIDATLEPVETVAPEPTPVSKPKIKKKIAKKDESAVEQSENTTKKQKKKGGAMDFVREFPGEE
jgi:serine/threonine protein kinase